MDHRNEFSQRNRDGVEARFSPAYFGSRFSVTMCTSRWCISSTLSRAYPIARGISLFGISVSAPVDSALLASNDLIFLVKSIAERGARCRPTLRHRRLLRILPDLPADLPVRGPTCRIADYHGYSMLMRHLHNRTFGRLDAGNKARGSGRKIQTGNGGGKTANEVGRRLASRFALRSWQSLVRIDKSIPWKSVPLLCLDDSSRYSASATFTSTPRPFICHASFPFYFIPPPFSASWPKLCPPRGHLHV